LFDRTRFYEHKASLESRLVGDKVEQHGGNTIQMSTKLRNGGEGRKEISKSGLQTEIWRCLYYVYLFIPEVTIVIGQCGQSSRDNIIIKRSVGL